jgi:hypothetical protein
MTTNRRETLLAAMRETMQAANARLACLHCGVSGGMALQLADGRLVRACESCLRMDFLIDWARGERVFEVAGADAQERGDQLCRCHMCGVVERCTPEADFYGLEGERLVCERCLPAQIGLSGPLVRQEGPDDHG